MDDSTTDTYWLWTEIPRAWGQAWRRRRVPREGVAAYLQDGAEPIPTVAGPTIAWRLPRTEDGRSRRLEVVRS